MKDKKLYPSVSMSSKDEHVKLNFGDHGINTFRFDLKAKLNVRLTYFSHKKYGVK